MPRPDRAVILNLETFSWDTITTAGGSVPAETPYIWTIFFRADGSTLRVTAGAGVVGAAIVESTPVSREDLGGHGIALGSSVRIPPAIGFWSATIKPIPVDPSLNIGADLPGQFGAIIVTLVQNGYLTDALATAGYQAAVEFVTEAIANLVASLGPLHTQITDDDIASVTDGAGAAVSNAIRSAASTWQEIEIYFDGTDINVGSKTLHFSQDQFPASVNHLDINEPVTAPAWQWSVHGAVDVTDTCPATTLASVDGGRHASPAVIDALHAFRDRDIAAMPGIAWWWDRMSQHTAELARLARSDRDLAAKLGAAFSLAPAALGDGHHEVPAATLAHAHDLALHVARLGSRSLRDDARHVATMLAAITNRRLDQVEHVFRSGRDRVTAQLASPKS